MTEHLTTAFVCLWLIAGEKPATECEAAWLALDGRGEVAWEVGRTLGLVGPADRPWASFPPHHPVTDSRHDLNTLRARAHPVPVPQRMRN